MCIGFDFMGNSDFEEFLKRVEERARRSGMSRPTPAHLSYSDYEQPALTSQTLERIRELSRISKKIERNLVDGKAVSLVSKDFKIDYKASLNPSQYAAATTVDGPLLVIAGAGSGKTRTIVYRVAFLIESGVPPESILLLTFTRKAANEMISRTSDLLDDMRCQQVTGGTFHSFANHFLRRYSALAGVSAGFTIADTVDSEDIIDLCRRELHLEKHKKAFPRKARLQEIISRARNCGMSVSEVVERDYSGLVEFTKEMDLISRAFDTYKKSHQIFDFDDLMERLRDSLAENARFRNAIQGRFNYIMVDEFQDTNLVQKEIADQVAASHRNIMVVGDDSQSIYSFRGANFENILRFPETYPDCKYVKIEQNYRSNQDILDFTNSLISKAQLGYRKNLYSTKNSRGKPHVKRLFDQPAEAEFIVSKILELREHGVGLNQIAVLYRASHHGNFIQAELLTHNIPYVVYGGIRFIERRHVKDIIAYLKIIQNPLDAISWNRILHLIPGVGGVTASRIVNHIQKQEGSMDFSGFEGKKYAPGLEELGETLMKARKDGLTIPERIDVFAGYYAPILDTLEDDSEVRLKDIDVLCELARRYEDLEKFLSDFALDPPSNRFQDKTTPSIDGGEEGHVVLSTVHSAKGLEWRTVFVAHLLDGLFPIERSLVNLEQLEEERRLFYVACTRAKEELYLTLPSSVSSWGAFYTRESRFLAEIEKDKYLLND